MLIRHAATLFLLGLFLAQSAHAQTAARTFLSSTGSDTNTCSAFSPCRTLTAGINAVVAGGDVIILDSGGYGEGVVITKSVSVIAQPGVVARLRSSVNNTAVSINSAGISVTLDGIGITGANGVGVWFVSGAALVLRNMDVSVTGNYSIRHNSAGGQLAMDNVTMRGSSAHTCFYTAGSSTASAFSTIVNSRAYQCLQGFYAGPYSQAAIENTTAAGPGVGNSVCVANFYAFGATNQNAVMVLDNVVSTSCTRGVAVGQGGSILSVSNSLITMNAQASGIGAGGIGRTYQNNRSYNNGSDALTGFASLAPQ